MQSIMIEPNVFIAKVSKDANGKYAIIEGSTKNINNDFNGVYYQSADGIETHGTPWVYTEEYPESNELDVYFSENNTFKSTDFTLKLYFIAPDGKKDNEAIDYIINAYNSFFYFVSGHLILYWDNVRKRKLLLALTESVKPSTTSVLSGREYLAVSFKFKNLFGRSFTLSDTTCFADDLSLTE